MLLAILGDFPHNCAVFVYIRRAGKSKLGRLSQHWAGFELIVWKKVFILVVVFFSFIILYYRYMYI